MVAETIKRALRPVLHRLVVNDRLFDKYMGWRRSRLKSRYVSWFGNTVASGPFSGTRLRPEWSELPKFLGTYKSPLHPYLHKIITDTAYDQVLNIGCAEGYYAVGIATAIPRSLVKAFDIDLVQRQRCKDNAILNGLADRVKIERAFNGELFNSFTQERVLVICDIEGHEAALLDPARYEGLKRLDMIVELHEHSRPDIVDLFSERFSISHEITYVPRQLLADLAPIEKLFDTEMDQLAAIYENRVGRTSWMVLFSRHWIGSRVTPEENEALRVARTRERSLQVRFEIIALNCICSRYFIGDSVRAAKNTTCCRYQPKSS